jgi:uncharacterized membrane protein
MVNLLAAEICQGCGAELGGLPTTAAPTSGYALTTPFVPTSEPTEEEFETRRAIGPFVSAGAAIGSTIDLFRRNVWLITKIIFVVFAPFEIFKALSVREQETGWQTAAGILFLGLVCKALVAPSLIYSLVTVIRTGVAPSLTDCYRWGLGRLGKIVACASMAWVLEMLGFVCFIVPGIILTLAFELVYPMAALENLGPIEILKRSYHLTKGYRWRIFGASFVIGLLCMIVSIPTSIVAGILLSTGINVWPLEAAVSMINDIVNESTTILSLVIYLGILSLLPKAGVDPSNR